MDISGKVIMVTGAAGGIGSQLVDEFVRRGASKVYAGDLDADKVKPLQEKHGSMIVPLRMDVTREDLLKPLLQQCLDVDILVNNAGIKYGTDFVSLPAMRFAIVEMMVNYVGLHHMSVLLWESLKNRSGAIVNILSIASFEVLEGCATYCASKAAAHMLTLSLRNESKGTPLKIFGVYPGFVDTDMTRDSMESKADPKDVARIICDGISIDELEIFPMK